MEILIVLFFVGCGCFLYSNRSTPVGTKQDATPVVQQNKDVAISDWEKGLKILKRADNEVIEFTYETYEGRARRKITLKEVLQHDNGIIYLKGFCHGAQQDRTFNTNKICTMLKINSKRIEVDRYLEEKYDVG